MKTIIIPTDFSENASVAVNLALQINQEAACRFVFVNVSQPEIAVKLTDEQHIQALDAYKIAKEKELKEYIEKLGVTASSKREITSTVIISPLVSESICEIAKEQEADLVIMGTKGAGGMKKVLFGSNTSNIIQNSEVPVIAVPASYQNTDIEHIALATDLVNPEVKIQKVMELAHIFDAQLQLVHVYPNYPEMVKLETFNNQKFLEELKDKLAYKRIELHFQHTNTENDIHGGLKEFARVYKPDMIVMFTHKRSFWDKIFDGSKTEEVVYSTNIPLLAIKA